MNNNNNNLPQYYHPSRQLPAPVYDPRTINHIYGYNAGIAAPPANIHNPGNGPYGLFAGPRFEPTPYGPIGPTLRYMPPRF